MKWFHHECSAKHDPKLHLLGAAYGAEGMGVYWGLLEEIGSHSDTFHIKVAGVSAESDQAYVNALLHGEEPIVSVHALAGENIPIMDLGILARLLWITEKKLLRVIEKLVELGLFDQSQWRAYGLLHSPAFERRADDYTRRRRRNMGNARTHSDDSPDDACAHSEHSPDVVRTHSEHSPGNGCAHSAHCPTSVRHIPASVLQRDDTSPRNVGPEQEEKEKEIQKQKEKENRREKLCSVPSAFDLSTTYPHPRVRESDDDTVLVPSAAYYTEGMSPWVHLLTAPEEARRISHPRSPP